MITLLRCFRFYLRTCALFFYREIRKNDAEIKTILYRLQKDLFYEFKYILVTVNALFLEL